MDENSILVSIIIVSMNNYDDLKVCLNSIVTHNKFINYEIIVVAYTYHVSTLNILVNEYPSIKFIIPDNYPCGFSENNNLGIRYAHGKYLLILNDDTYFIDDSILQLTLFLENNKDIKVVSPHIKLFSGKTQFLGRSRYNLLGIWAIAFKFYNLLPKSKDENSISFKTFGILGACFLVEKEFFKEIGLFDEYYFFIPEDLAVAEEMLKRKIYPYVLKGATVYHKGSSSSFKMYPILTVVSKLGCMYYFEKYYGKYAKIFFYLSSIIISIFKLLYWVFNIFKINTDKRKFMISSHLNTIKYLNTNLSPKNLFIYLEQKYKR